MDSRPEFLITKPVAIGMAALLFIAVLPMPYGYYTLVRLASTVFFGYLSYCFFSRKQAVLGSVCLLSALLFQPLVKVGLGKEIWSVVDAIAGVFVIFLGWKVDIQRKLELPDG